MEERQEKDQSCIQVAVSGNSGTSQTKLLILVEKLPVRSLRSHLILPSSFSGATVEKVRGNDSPGAGGCWKAHSEIRESRSSGWELFVGESCL